MAIIILSLGAAAILFISLNPPNFIYRANSYSPGLQRWQRDENVGRHKYPSTQPATAPAR